MNKIITLDEFIIRTEKENPNSSGSFSRLLRDIGMAAKVVNREVNKAGLGNILGVAGSTNSTGDDVQKLDIFANDTFIETLSYGGEVCGIASEENQEFIPIKSNQNKQAQYIVVMDPLDGSSNIDVNVSVGTIFGIYKRKSPADGPCELSDFLQKGTEMVAAGYVLYGTSTLLVYSTGNGVNGFTLDTTIGEFCLSHKNIQMPVSGNYYSVNQG
ncbi:MAG: class 1 fructose-bisphosphatase, partial [Saprospiraceae bacterium]